MGFQTGGGIKPIEISENRSSRILVVATEAFMELYIFARFHASEGQDVAVAEALREVIGPTREQPRCLAINGVRSLSDPRLFYIHSRWTDEGAFEVHAELPHTVRFLQRVKTLIDHPLDVTRARPIA
jgi:quinol monooxygenase YgiN